MGCPNRQPFLLHMFQRRDVKARENFLWIDHTIYIRYFLLVFTLRLPNFATLRLNIQEDHYVGKHLSRHRLALCQR